MYLLRRRIPLTHLLHYLRRLNALWVLITIAALLLVFEGVFDRQIWKLRANDAAHRMAEKVGMGERLNNVLDQSGIDVWGPVGNPARRSFIPGEGITKPPGSNYSRVLVVPRTKKENVEWMDKELPNVDRKVYVADDLNADLHPPANKGHEAMVYLSYIIDNYENLPDVMIFMHNHRRAWHNNDVLNGDSAEIVRRLSSERVTREGYMNLRCQWYPGCPDWIHPGDTKFNIHKTEQALIARAWSEIFPMQPVPDVLAQPCCSQFALSKELVRSIPKATFEYYRSWILNTELKDFISGRVWEYMWQYAFTGEHYWCPVEHACYCDGYGICFGGRKGYEDWFNLRRERDRIQQKLIQWHNQTKKLQQAIEEGRLKDAESLTKPGVGKDIEYKQQIRAIQKDMDKRKNMAFKRGHDPRNRAAESGREWTEGDGF